MVLNYSMHANEFSNVTTMVLTIQFPSVNTAKRPFKSKANSNTPRKIIFRRYQLNACYMLPTPSQPRYMQHNRKEFIITHTCWKHTYTQVIKLRKWAHKNHLTKQRRSKRKCTQQITRSEKDAGSVSVLIAAIWSEFHHRINVSNNHVVGASHTRPPIIHNY